ncbi:MAG: glycerophosphodiester phosphodiesterase family protein [Clostridia bacterium]|nr:glycerophosphodiester phosphodiesterase family protein [Clostridia bacterium]
MKKFVSLLLCVILAASACSFSAFATSDSATFKEANAVIAEESTEKSVTFDSAVKVCASKGDWENAAENSIEAISACNCEYISVNVKVTADGIPVLMADDSLKRTVVDEKGEAVNGNVSDYKLDELQSFYLRNRNGGPHNKKTESKIPTLSEALNAASGKKLIIDFNIDDLDAVCEVINSSHKSAIVLRPNGKLGDIADKLAEKKSLPETIIKYDGNIIFSVNKALKTAKACGTNMVQLGTKNQYGVIYYNSVENKFKNNSIKTVYSMTDGYNGKRGDNVAGWDDVISHGYQIIETNYPEMLITYVQQSEELRQKLTTLTQKMDEYKGGAYPKNLMETCTTAYKNAVSVKDDVSSLSQLNEAYTLLNNSFNALDLSEGTTTKEAALDFSFGRIITVVLCLCAVVAAQIFFIKRRKK